MSWVGVVSTSLPRASRKWNTVGVCVVTSYETFPGSKVHGANMRPIWSRQDPGGPMLAPWTLLSGFLIVPKHRIKLDWYAKVLHEISQANRHHAVWCNSVSHKQYLMRKHAANKRPDIGRRPADARTYATAGKSRVKHYMCFGNDGKLSRGNYT